jgi:hypothetical protein
LGPFVVPTAPFSGVFRENRLTVGANGPVSRLPVIGYTQFFICLHTPLGQLAIQVDLLQPHQYSGPSVQVQL